MWDVGPDKATLVPSDLVENKEGRVHPLAWVEYTEGPSLKSALTFCVRHTGVLFLGRGRGHEVGSLLLSTDLGSTQLSSQRPPESCAEVQELNCWRPRVLLPLQEQLTACTSEASVWIQLNGNTFPSPYDSVLEFL